MMVRLPPELPETLAAYWAAIWAYHSLPDKELREGATRLLVDLALRLLDDGHVEAFHDLEPELARALTTDTHALQRVLRSAEEKKVPTPVLEAKQGRTPAQKGVS